MAAVTLVSSILTIRRDWVPAIRAKRSARLEPSAAVNDSDPCVSVESIACSAIADNSGTVSSARPIRLASSAGAAITIPALSIKTAVMPGRPDRLLMIFDSQSRLMPATITESESVSIAETG
jgi:hypothetical protein